MVLEMRRDFEMTIFSDLDQDGDDDIVGVAENKVRFLENDGNGNFAPETIIFSTVRNPAFIRVEDVNSDGFLDIILIWSSLPDSDGAVEIWGGTGNLNFNLETEITGYISTSATNEYFAYEDLNNDGLDDIVVMGWTSARYFQHTSGFNFTFVSSLAIEHDIAIGDVNNDGWPDIVGGSWEFFRVALNDSTGNFPTLSGNYGPGFVMYTNHSDLELIDADNDGDLDVVQLINGDKDIFLYYNNGMAVYAQGPTLYDASFSDNIWNLTTRDFNNDGIIDLAWKRSAGSQAYNSGWIKGLLGNGTSFGSEFTLNQSITGVPAMDFSDNLGNGVDNLLLYGGINDVFKRIIVASETTPGIYSNESYYREMYDNPYTSMITTDIDNDGYIDFMSPPHFYMNQGDGSFVSSFDSTFVASPSWYTYYVYDHGDLNNDGYEDLVGVRQHSNSNIIGYWPGTSGGNFGSFVGEASENGVVINNVSVHDINNDGYLDFYYTRKPWSNNPEIHHVINQGGTGFYEYEYMENWGNINLSVYDEFDEYKFARNDTASDNIEYAYVIDNEISVATNGNFTPQTITTQGRYIGIVDIDLDGLSDIFYVNETSGIGWIKNMSGGVFTNQGLLYTQSNDFCHPVYKDLDNDWDVDVLLTDDTLLYWIENLGQGVFAAPVLLSDKAKGSYWPEGGYLYAEDLESDGDVDLLFIKEVDTWYGTGSFPQLWGDLYKLDNLAYTSNEASGFVFHDLNSNKIWDVGEPALPNVSLSLNGIYEGFSNANGAFHFNPAYGNHNIAVNIPQHWSLTTDSTSFNILLSDQFPTVDSLSFGLLADTIIYSSQGELIGSYPSCNSTINLWVGVQNTGTMEVSGVVEVVLDPSLTYVSAQTLPDSIVGNSYYWSYDSLNVFSYLNLNLNVQTPGPFNAGDTVTSMIYNHVFDSLGVVIDISEDSLFQIIQCDYAANYKSVEPMGISTPGYVQNDQTMEFVVRFQNTGNTTVNNVRIVDQLDAKLDPSTLEIIAFSHPMTSYVEPTGKLVCEFDSISLPSSNTNFLLSQGFVKFRVDMLAGLVAGDEIQNSAQVSYDFTFPDSTNTTLNTIYSCNELIDLSNISTWCAGEKYSVTLIDPVLMSGSWYVNNVFYTTDDTLEFIPSVPNDLIGFIGSNNSCSVDTSFLINVISPATVTAWSDTTICEGDSSLVTASGAISYSWDFGGGIGDSVYLAPSTTTTYTVTGTDGNGCENTDQVTITVNPIPTVVAYGSATICEGDTIPLGAGGALSFVWDNGAGSGLLVNVSPTATTTYTVTGTSNGCSNTDQVTVTVNPLPSVSMDAFNPDLICNTDGMFSLPIATPSGGTYSGAGVIGSNFDPSLADTGNHVVSYTYIDTNMCSATDVSSITIQDCSEIDELAQSIGVKVYPNPASNEFFIEVVSSIAANVEKISIFDVTGREIETRGAFELSPGQNTIYFNAASYSKGHYTVYFFVNDETYVQKVILD
jgi:hypothetical protein